MRDVLGDASCVLLSHYSGQGTERQPHGQNLGSVMALSVAENSRGVEAVQARFPVARRRGAATPAV